MKANKDKEETNPYISNVRLEIPEGSYFTQTKPLDEFLKDKAMDKDKGTSVGFSKVTPESYDGKRFEGNSDEPLRFAKPNTVCKEHEFTKTRYTYSDEGKSIKSFYICGKCGFAKPITEQPIDFKISENIEVINKQEWEDIVLEFENHVVYETEDDYKLFKKWLKENYLAPEKKIT